MKKEDTNQEFLHLPTELVANLEESGHHIDSLSLQRLTRHIELIKQWNNYASLVSIGDLQHLAENHVVDALSLLPYISSSQGLHLDIGSGGGFPAIPLKCVLPELEIILVERSAKKCGFLRKVIGALGLERISILQGEFPKIVERIMPTTVTARAVERPTEILKSMQQWLPCEARFLVQSGDPSLSLGEEFHVEQIEDIWSNSGLRRGSLYIAQRKSESQN